MKPLLLMALTCLLAIGPVYSQEIKTLTFDETPIVKNPTSHGYEKVYKVVSDSIKFRSYGGKITYPEGFAAEDTGYVCIFFTGIPESSLPNGSAILIANYKSSEPTFWIDPNGDFNFREDGFAVSYDSESEEPHVILPFRNRDNPKGIFPVKLYRAPLDSSSIYGLKTYFGTPGKQKNGSVIEDYEYWFHSQRADTKIFVGEVDGQKLKLGLMDWDCDGLFLAEGEDRLMVTKDIEAPLSSKGIDGAVVLTDSCYWFLDQTPYRILEVDPAGKNISIEKSELEIEPPLRIGDVLPNYTLVFDKDTSSIDEMLQGKDFLFIDIWGSWCGGCHQQVPAVKTVYQNYSEVVQFVGLNAGDTHETKANFETKYEIPWKSGFLSPQIKGECDIQGFPTYMLIDSDRKLIIYQGNTYYILKHLKEHYASK